MLVKLGEDVLIQIIHFVHGVDRTTIFSLNVVNRFCHSLSIPFVYHECTFIMDKNGLARAVERIQGWLDPDGTFTRVPACIHQISLLKPDYDKYTQSRIHNVYELDDKSWSLILKFLPHLINLKRFIFSCADWTLPSDLLHALERHNPAIRLSVKDWNLGGYRYHSLREVELNEDEKLLAHSPLLRELQMFNPDTSHETPFRVFTQLVALAPSLEKIVIDETPDHRRGFRCGNAYRTATGTQSSFADILRLQPDELASISLRTGPRDLRLWSAPARFVLYCMSRFERVETFHSNFLLYGTKISTFGLPTGFYSLRHLTLWLQGGVEDDITFNKETNIITPRTFLLELCPPHQLESFTLRFKNPITYLPSVLQRHGGPKLRSLTLGHDLRDPSSRATFSPFSPDIIATLIADECSPSLTRLALSVSRVDEKKNDLLRSFGRFRRLQHLTLDFGSGLTYFKKSYDPYYDPHTSIHLQGSPPDKERLDRWEMEILNLQMPISTGEVENMFNKIREGGCGMLETLEVVLRHPFGSETEQKFLVRRISDVTYRTTVEGYVLPTEGDSQVYKHDPKLPRLERLKLIWDIANDLEPTPLPPPLGPLKPIRSPPVAGHTPDDRLLYQQPLPPAPAAKPTRVKRSFHQQSFPKYFQIFERSNWDS